MAKYIVTGGTGFIGTRLVERLLAEGHEIHVLSRGETMAARNTHITHDSLTYHNVDVRKAESVNAFFAQHRDASGCYHLAGIANVFTCEQKPEATALTNIQGTINVFSACAEGTIPAVLASTAMVGTQTAYGRQKEAAETKALEIMGDAAGIIRFYNVYGPAGQGVTNLFIDKAMRGEPLTVFGDGTQMRDMIHVDDIVTFLTTGMDMLQSGANERVLHACTSISYTTTEIAEIVAQEVEKATERKVEIVYQESLVGTTDLSLSGAPNPELRTKPFHTGVAAIIAEKINMENIAADVHKSPSPQLSPPDSIA